MKIGMIAPPWFPLPPKGYGGIELVVLFDIARQDERGADGGRQRFQPLGLSLALISESDLGALSRQRARDAPSDGMVVGHPHHQSAAAFKQG